MNGAAREDVAEAYVPACVLPVEEPPCRLEGRVMQRRMRAACGDVLRRHVTAPHSSRLASENHLLRPSWGSYRQS